VITWANGGDKGGGTIDQVFNGQPCHTGGILTVLYEVSVKDDHDTMQMLDVELHWTGKNFSGSRRMGIRGPVFAGSLGPFNVSATNGVGDVFTMSITATDSGAKTTTLPAKPVTLQSCPIIP